MIHKNIISAVIYILLLLWCSTPEAYAQLSQQLSVTPPLFQVSLKPGDVWQSSVKVVNANPYPLTVYAEVVNFEAFGESGQGNFVPIINSGQERVTLAEWFTLTSAPQTIDPEQTKNISFFIDVPEDASPGGHYAAIMISTRPIKSPDTLAVSTSQAVTSLFFMRIEGDVEEKGSIREFAVLESFRQRPSAEFSLRFENKGNVHLQPRGNIIISNMWGKERGVIPINSNTHFGNVLPKSIRDFRFAWESDFNITDVGRYKAATMLSYGNNGAQSATATTYFWVFPIKATLITLASISFIIFMIVWMVKAYIRRMLMLAGVDVAKSNRQAEIEATHTHRERVSSRAITYKNVSAPIRDGVLDLRQKLSTGDKSRSAIAGMSEFIVEYKKFFISIAVLCAIFISLSFYFGTVANEQVEYEITIDEGNTKKTISSDEVKLME